MKIVRVILAIALVSTTFISSSADAIELNKETVNGVIDTAENFNNSMEGILEDALDYLVTVLGDRVGNDCPEILRIIPGSCPDGGILDANSIPRTSGGFRQVSLPNAEFFTSNSMVIERDFANLYDREYARAEAARLTGDAGQEWLDENVAVTASLIESNELIAEEVSDLALEAQGLDVTQDVMKNMTQIQSRVVEMSLNESQIDAQMQASLLALQQQQASVMQNIANLGESLDEKNRRDRLEREALYLQESRSLVYIPAFKW